MTPIITFFVLILIFIWCLNAQSFLSDDELYYHNYKYDIKNPNFTLAAVAPQFVDNQAFISTGYIFAAVCQADQINQGFSSSVNISGTINIAVQMFQGVSGSGQQSTMSLFENNLYNSSTNIPIYGNKSTPVMGFFGFIGTGTSQINSFISDDYNVPFVCSGTRSAVDPDNKILFSSGGSLNNTFYQIRGTEVFDSFQATLDVLSYFNWTVVGAIFQDNSYGYGKQASAQLFQTVGKVPNFVCSQIISFKQFKNDSSIVQDFCQCINEKNGVSVIVLWMATTEAIFAINTLKSTCSSANKWTFIITYDIDFNFNVDLGSNVLKDTLILRQFSNWNFKRFASNCIETASAQAKSTLQELETKIYAESYQCQAEQTADLNQICQLPYYYRQNDSCLCNLDELGQDVYTSKYFFTADAITLYALAVSLLQNNCTYLNEVVKGGRKDYCEITTFDSSDITAVMRYVNFTGYSGEINFGLESVTRLQKTYYLYNIQTTIIDAVQVGALSISSVSINESAIQFVDGVVPVSMIIPQSPDLSYAVVAVFFALAIVLMIICLIVFILFVYYRNDPIIRRNTPIVSILMLVGVVLGILTVIFNSMAVNDALCSIDLFTYTGFYALLLSGLIVKNYRIYRIFTNVYSESLTISELSLILAMISVFAVFWIVATIAVVFGFGAVSLQSTTNPYYFYVTCALPNSTWSVILRCFIQISIVILLLILLIFSWLTRNINSRYSESKEMAAFFVVSAALFIVLTPLYLTLGSETNSELLKYIILAELILISTFAALLILFTPKLYQIYRK